MSWLGYALLSAAFAAATAILAKVGVEGVPSTLATALRTGVATGLSWLAYLRALQLAPASRVAPIDKLSLAMTLVLAVLVLREPFTWRLGLGVAFIGVGALLTLK